MNLSLYSDSASGQIAQRSCLQLTGSRFFLCLFSSFFSSDGRSWAASRASVGGPGPLSVPLWVAPSRSQGLCGRCWRVLKLLWAVLGSLRSALRCYVGGLGPLLGPMFAVSGLMLAVLGRSWGLCSRSWASCWRSWVALGPSVGGLGPLLEPTLAILGRSWNLCWRSWDVLGPKRSVLGRSGRSWEGIRAEKWPKPEPEGRSGEAMVFPRFSGAGPSCRFLFL